MPCRFGVVGMGTTPSGELLETRRKSRAAIGYATIAPMRMKPAESHSFPLSLGCLKIICVCVCVHVEKFVRRCVRAILISLLLYQTCPAVVLYKDRSSRLARMFELVTMAYALPSTAADTANAGGRLVLRGRHMEHGMYDVGPVRLETSLPRIRLPCAVVMGKFCGQ
jgi:hypothetical protein